MSSPSRNLTSSIAATNNSLGHPGCPIKINTCSSVIKSTSYLYL